MGKYYFLNDSTTECEECFQNVVNNAKKRGDIDLQCLALEKLSRSIVLSNKRLSVIYAKKAVDLYSNQKNAKIANLILYMLNLANCYILDNQKDSSFFYLRQSQQYLNRISDNSMPKYVYHSLSRAFYYFNEKDSALFYSRKAIDETSDIKLMVFYSCCLEECD